MAIFIHQLSPEVFEFLNSCFDRQITTDSRGQGLGLFSAQQLFGGCQRLAGVAGCGLFCPEK